jgi:hypothetical protein
LSVQAEAAPARSPGLTLAAIVLISVGCFRLVSAIYYFADSNRVNNVESGAFSHHLIYWGFWDLVIAALALTAGVSLLRGRELGFMLGYGFAGLVVFQSFLLIAATPWFAVASLVMAILVIHALATNDKRGVGYR